MRKVILLGIACGFALLALNTQPAFPQTKEKFGPPKVILPSDDVLNQIAEKTAQLAAKIAELRKNPKHHELLPDVEIFLRGAESIVRFKEFYHKDSGKWTLDTLDRGLERAETLASGAAPPWTTPVIPNVVRGHRSSVDGTAQPYGITYPNGYGKDVDKKRRVDIVLHGRNSTLTEVSFLNTHNGKKKPPADQDWVQIDIFGRGNNAYRWAGETDVLEAMEAFFANEAKAGRGEMADRRRVVLRGFSMGGAGAWHLGLHHPDKWCVMGPGAGFTTTHDYAWKGKKALPDYQERCLRIYDAIDYVENARMIPIVAYSGGEDSQKLAADNIENRLKELKIDAMTHLIKPGVGHKFEADYFQKANALWAERAATGRSSYPNRVSFVAYSTKHSICDWVAIASLEKHFEKATVNAEITENGCRVATTNVRVIGLVLPPPIKDVTIEIDRNKVIVPALPKTRNGGVPGKTSIVLVREGAEWKNWRPGRPIEKGNIACHYGVMLQGVAQNASLQGPIDDAFASGFVCVTGTGETWHPATQKFVDAKVAAFKHDWAKHWRGELPITNEYGISPNEIKEKHLILFGDPSSNFLLANILPKLPLKWTKDEIEFAGKKFKAGEHVPVLIFPNPLNPSKYVVLNTGHTWPSEDYAKTNALLYPRLGDYAILRMTPAGYEVATAGLFDEFWRVERK
ncbi:MAG: hypothetical protein EXR98_11615 [Gemmataceae bacterium]|nr:hypothetical protein [Gemmataceae bacterium]